ncbi:MAG: DUF1059 domain-containing protein [Chloroflexota bacterium]
MAKELCCSDLFPDCTKVVRGKDDEEVMEKAAEHVQQVHHVEVISPMLAKKVAAAVHEA